MNSHTLTTQRARQRRKSDESNDKIEEREEEEEGNEDERSNKFSVSANRCVLEASFVNRSSPHHFYVLYNSAPENRTSSSTRHGYTFQSSSVHLTRPLLPPRPLSLFPRSLIVLHTLAPTPTVTGTERYIDPPLSAHGTNPIRLHTPSVLRFSLSPSSPDPLDLLPLYSTPPLQSPRPPLLSPHPFLPPFTWAPGKAFFLSQEACSPPALPKFPTRLPPPSLTYDAISLPLRLSLSATCLFYILVLSFCLFSSSLFLAFLFCVCVVSSPPFPSFVPLSFFLSPRPPLLSLPSSILSSLLLLRFLSLLISSSSLPSHGSAFSLALLLIPSAFTILIHALPHAHAPSPLPLSPSPASVLLCSSPPLISSPALRLCLLPLLSLPLALLSLPPSFSSLPPPLARPSLLSTLFLSRFLALPLRFLSPLVFRAPSALLSSLTHPLSLLSSPPPLCSLLSLLVSLSLTIYENYSWYHFNNIRVNQNGIVRWCNEKSLYNL
ncbi:hypothetical protein C7M84_007451 [Penaeus vannamei]|uniref:Uncharacterized protein n=1 Tax=Penaeus vannamei TaxID=6689 RepID=A0A423TC42_PENVA|nr:hypothetical protein C7M84_007451 [Penaeus vannamei]